MIGMKKQTKTIIVIIGILMLLVLISGYVIEQFYVNGPFKYPKFREVLSSVRNEEYMGLTFEECSQKYYSDNSYSNIYENRLISDNGITNGIEHSYHTRFYICYSIEYLGFGGDGRRWPYICEVFFDENKKAVYAEVYADKRGG